MTERNLTPRQERIRYLEERAQRRYIDQMEWSYVQEALPDDEQEELTRLYKEEEENF